MKTNLRASSDGNSKRPSGVKSGSSRGNFHRDESGTDSKMWRQTFERLRTEIRRDPSGSHRVHRGEIFTETDQERENRQRTFWTSIRGTLTGTSDHRGGFSRGRFSSPGFCPGSRGSFRPQAEIQVTYPHCKKPGEIRSGKGGLVRGGCHGVSDVGQGRTHQKVSIWQPGYNSQWQDAAKRFGR